MKTRNFTLLKSMMIGLGLISFSAGAQDARVQVIHNSADAATQTVDVYAGATLLLDDFEFRTASPFIDVAPGTLQVGIAAGNSMSADDTLIAFDLDLMASETYVVIANGILSGTGYTPAPGITLDVYAMGREEAANAGETDVLVFHGSTDAPTVDVVAVGAGTVVDDAAYGDFNSTGYLELANADYTLNVTDQTGSTVVASFQAPLQTLGLADSAVTVIASGFLDPSVNSSGPAFGLWVALPEGGDLVELPSSESRLQVIHNSADLAAEEVDVYFNDALLVDDFAFRTAAGYIDVPAEVAHVIGIAPATSNTTGNGIDDTLVAIPVTFAANESYVAIANGIISMTGYSPAPGFSLDVYDMGQETSNVAGNTDVLVFHGSTDAPTVDVAEVSVPAGTIVDDASYGDFTNYLELGTADYILEVQDMAGTTTLFSYSAPLSTLMLDDLGIVVVASGFVDPSMNSNGAGFGLWVALPTGGDLVELPTAFLSIDENDFDFNVYPNPSNDWIKIDGIESNGVYEIIDMTGKTIWTSTIQDQQTIDVSNIAPGAYLMKITVEGETSVTQISVR